ncbi:MAG: phosphatidate cytidylyltransferase [Caldicoprobacter oshimai]|uniref:Phosphatidate cytidylyltransferase n=1 Tax=Caldicoprobacter faecalis TaxID=937334 RepID=A0A1I5RQL4_9FIRM|nr:phosphatidate cytidylyltransferase [Caldicoprobacter faecalis]PZN10842.1 MAG: phosphatidate cytidylyltransferase [Caldicoprobacter oshimai]SFP60541.1 phosphatidate cytidylyltransferase [Caldicoprobacter faecalis]
MLILRIASAAIGIAYLILAFYVGGWFLDLSVLVISLIGMHEFYTAVRHRGYNPLSWVGYLFISLLFWFITLYSNDSHTILLGALLAAFFCLFLTVVFPRLNFLDACLTVFGCIYPGMAFMYLILLYDADTYGKYLLIFTLFATWATDTFAYFTGLALGKNKLCPRISPKKTVEGSIGGILGSLIIGILVGMVFTHFYKVEIGYLHYAIISLLCGITSQMGDLSASSIKRFCNIKDFGRIMPGHGGILDRFDSIIFTVPIVYLYYLLFLN